MRMTKHDGDQARRIGIGVEFHEAVKDPDGMSTNLDQVLRRKVVRPWSPVVLAADCANRRKSPERLQDGWITDVAAMNDEV